MRVHRTAALALLGILLVPVSSRVQASPSRYGLPDKIHSLSETNALAEKHIHKEISDLQATEVFLYWIAKERLDSTAPFTGLSGAPIDSGYILMDLTGMLANGDVTALDLLSEDRRVAPEMRDIIRLALGLKGDRRQIPFLKKMVVEHKEPRLRERAAEALGISLRAYEARAALERAEKDPFYIDETTPGARFEKPGRYYPVRRAASGVLAFLNDTDPAEPNPVVDLFEEKLAEGRKDSDAHRVAPWVLEAISVEGMKRPARKLEASTR